MGEVWFHRFIQVGGSVASKRRHLTISRRRGVRAGRGVQSSRSLDAYHRLRPKDSERTHRQWGAEKTNSRLLATSRRLRARDMQGVFAALDLAEYTWQ